MNALDYFKDRYKDEAEIFKHIEDKASKMLSFLSVIIIVLVAAAGFKSGALFHMDSKSPLSWIKFASFMASLFCVAWSWLHALFALQIDKCPVLPRGESMASFLCFYEDAEDEEKDPSKVNANKLLVRDTLLKSYVSTIRELKDLNERKAKHLEKSFTELSISAGCLALCATVTIGMEIFK